MLSVVHLIGTSHHFQLGAGKHFGQYACPDTDALAFGELLRTAVWTHRPDAIAEELNREALVEAEASISVAEEVAKSLGLRHVFCEPDRGERVTLGIMDENAVRATAFFDCRSE